MIVGLTAVALAGGLAVPADTVGPAPFLALPAVDGPLFDRARLSALESNEPGGGVLLRSPSSLLQMDSGSGSFRWWAISPETRLAHNSDLPLSLNEAGVWTGQGWSASVLTGAVLKAGPLTLVAAPRLIYQENGDFPLIPASVPGRDTLLTPWYNELSSIDLPQRYGAVERSRATLGESSLTLRLGGVEAGIAHEHVWWGPGQRNAIVLSSNAPAFPHSFVRSATPLRVPLGTLEGAWLLGRLSESEHFDSIAGNDSRSLSGLIAVFRPDFDRSLALGLSRVVYASAGDLGDVAGHALDALTIGNPRARTGPEGETRGWDQLTAAFARWALPGERLEVYAELARAELPTSFRDWLIAPQHSQGYTLGGQWLSPEAPLRLRIAAETTYLEQSSTFTQTQAPTFYVSRTVPQGYTHRGRVLGAAIGPGASSQWGQLDLLASDWILGFSGSRIRWHNDAYYRSDPNLVYAHDVSLIAAFRLGYRGSAGTIQAEIGREWRYNYLFQNDSPGFEPTSAVDIQNSLVRIVLRPLVR